MTSIHADPDPRAALASALLGPLADYWWLQLVRGVAAIAFGILAFVWPGMTLVTLTFLWGAYALVDGVFMLWAAITGKRQKMPRWWLALVGLAGIISGVLAFAMPLTVAGLLLLFIAAWAIVIGVMELWGAIRLRKEIDGEWMLALSGLLAIAFGVALIVWPLAGALALVWLIGWFAIVVGVVYIGLAFQLRKHRRPA
jgi:uncharacterized membrane protein HdeD (DUF308 family)